MSAYTPNLFHSVAWGDGATANAFGTSASAEGADSIDSVRASMATPPETHGVSAATSPKPAAETQAFNWWNIFGTDVPGSTGQSGISQFLASLPTKAEFAVIIIGLIVVSIGVYTVTKD